MFGRLDDIFVMNDRLLFNVTVMETTTLNEHVKAYTVTPTSRTMNTQLLIPFPVHIHHSVSPEANLVIVCKHHISGTL